jgi:hypothetical protein
MRLFGYARVSTDTIAIFSAVWGFYASPEAAIALPKPSFQHPHKA